MEHSRRLSVTIMLIASADRSFIRTGGLVNGGAMSVVNYEVDF